jgi:hypothetical protein
MAAQAGFALESRHANWVGSEFNSESPSQMSVYRLPPAPPGDSVATGSWCGRLVSMVAVQRHANEALADGPSAANPVMP